MKKNNRLLILKTAILIVSILVISTINVKALEQTWDYTYKGSTETWKVPFTGDYKIEVWGAQGQNNGGLGGKSQATFSLKSGDTLYIHVGGSNGYNGGGTGSYSGGGATDVRLNNDAITSRLISGAGGGGQVGGTDGGTGNGQGGASVGAGNGANGTYGGGGGASYDYTYETGYWQEKGYYRDTGYWEDTGYWKSGSRRVIIGYEERCHSSDYKYDHAGGCNVSSSTAYSVPIYGTEYYSYWVDTGRVWVSTGTEWVSTGEIWRSTGYRTISGKPGQGGSNFISSTGKDQISLNGVQVGNGHVKITQLNFPPVVTVTNPVQNVEVISGTNVTLSGTIMDRDNEGQMTVKYSINNNTPITVQTFAGSNVAQSFTTTVFIPINIAGNHILNVWGEDDKGGVGEKEQVTLNVKDVINPTLSLLKSTTEWTNQGVVITATASDNHAIKRIKLPNGNYVNSSTTAYVATDNGEYTFVAEDFSGNTVTETITVSNIENKPPNPATIHANENWTQLNQIVSMSDNGDIGIAGVDRIEYSLSGATSQGWTKYVSPIQISSEGKTIVSARVIDKLDNVSSVTTKEIKIDRTNPIATITPDVINLTNTDIELTISAIDSLSGVKRIKLPDGNWINGSQTKYQVGTNGTYLFVIEDNAGNLSTAEQIIKNIKKNVLITNKREVLLELHAEDLYSGVTHMQLKNEGEPWLAFEAYRTTKDWVLPPVDGLKHVWVQYRDKVGNISPAIEDIIVLDTTTPTISLFEINDNNPFTKSTNVTLKINVTDELTGIKEMYLSNDNVNWTKVPYSETKDWVLSNGEGLKSVYVKVSDNAGNISNVVADTIFFDATKPTANISINNNSPYTGTREVTLTLTYSDENGSGVDIVKIIEDGKEYILPRPVPNSPTNIPWTLDFGVVRTVSIIVIDKAGNVSDMSSDSIIVDKLTIEQFTLEEVINPLEFNNKNPFTPKVWAFAPQPMLSGGNITFAIDIKKATDTTIVNDEINYKVEVIGDNGYHRVFMGEMNKIGDHYTKTLTMPNDAPNGSKVYVNATAQRKLLVSPYDVQTVHFPDMDASSKAQIGYINGNIYDVIRFNEIQ